MKISTRTKYLFALTVNIILFGLLLAGCTESDRVRDNLSNEADNFNVVRKVTVLNAITNDVMFQMSGRMSIVADRDDNQLEIIVENKKGQYQKHIIGLSDNVSYVVEDLEVKDVSKYRYQINYNPKMWIPVEPKIVDSKKETFQGLFLFISKIESCLIPKFDTHFTSFHLIRS